MPPQALTQRPSGRLGLVIRSLLVLVWLVLFGLHSWGPLARGLGLEQARDVAGIFAAHADRDYLYDLQMGDRLIGTATQTYTFSDGRHRIAMRLDLEDLAWLPMATLFASQLHSALGIDLTQGIDLELATLLGQNFRLEQVLLTGRLGAVPVAFDGRVGREGLVGTLSFGEFSTRQRLPGFGAGKENSGIALAGAMPAGLEPGDSFTLRSYAPDAAPPHVKEVVTEYLVEEREQRQTRAGMLELLRIRLRREEREAGLLYCDGAGILYEAEEPQMGLRLRLRAIRHQARLIWPPEAVTRP